MQDKCMVCDKESFHSAFCCDHSRLWCKSEERKMVDFSSEDSYNEQVSHFVRNNATADTNIQV